MFLNTPFLPSKMIRKIKVVLTKKNKIYIHDKPYTKNQKIDLKNQTVINEKTKKGNQVFF